MIESPSIPRVLLITNTFDPFQTLATILTMEEETYFIS